MCYFIVYYPVELRNVPELWTFHVDVNVAVTLAHWEIQSFIGKVSKRKNITWVKPVVRQLFKHTSHTHIQFPSEISQHSMLTYYVCE